MGLSERAQKLLTALRDAPGKEIKNIELVTEISHRFSIYVEELRKVGYDLETKRLADNKFSTVLHEPARNETAPPMFGDWRAKEK